MWWMGKLLHSLLRCSGPWSKGSNGLDRSCMDWSLYWRIQKMGAHGLVWKFIWPTSSLRKRLGQETNLCDIDFLFRSGWHNTQIRFRQDNDPHEARQSQRRMVEITLKKDAWANVGHAGSRPQTNLWTEISCWTQRVWKRSDKCKRHSFTKIIRVFGMANFKIWNGQQGCDEHDGWFLRYRKDFSNLAESYWNKSSCKIKFLKRVYSPSSTRTNKAKGQTNSEITRRNFYRCKTAEGLNLKINKVDFNRMHVNWLPKQWLLSERKQNPAFWPRNQRPIWQSRGDTGCTSPVNPRQT